MRIINNTRSSKSFSSCSLSGIIKNSIGRFAVKQLNNIAFEAEVLVRPYQELKVPDDIKKLIISTEYLFELNDAQRKSYLCHKKDFNGVDATLIDKANKIATDIYDKFCKKEIHLKDWKIDDSSFDAETEKLVFKDKIKKAIKETAVVQEKANLNNLNDAGFSVNVEMEK